MSGDSFAYLSNAEWLATKIASGSVQGWEWLGGDLAIMPLFPWLLTANVLAAGKLAPLTTVLLQGAVDGCTCIIVAKIAETIAPRFAVPAGAAASLNPTQIVLSGLLYTDTLFLFFATLSLYGAARWYRSPDWWSALLTALALGLAAATRVVIVPWVPVVILFLLMAVAFHRRLRAVHLGHLAMVGGIVSLCLSPVGARNLVQYQVWALTPQGGTHLALWIAPLVKESQDGTPWAASSKAAEEEVRRRFPEQSANPFVESERHAQYGRETLARYGIVATTRAWLIGAAINLGAPAAIISPPVSALPRTGFYATGGSTMIEKVSNFLFHSDNAVYASILLAGIGGVAVLRLIQAVGLMAALRERGSFAIVLMLALWVGFILAINGPIASPKYRLPAESVLSLLTGLGAYSIHRRRRLEPLRP